MWAALGIALLGVVMRIDYRSYREPVFIWTCLGVVTVWRWSRCCSARRSTARGAGSAIGGLGIQPSELAKLSAIFFIAALLERRMHRINDVGLRAGCRSARGRRGLVGLILLEPDFGTSMSLALIAAVMVFAAGLSYVYIAGAALALLPLIAVLVIGVSVPAPAAAGVPQSLGRPARRRLPDHPVAHRRRHRRRLRAAG